MKKTQFAGLTVIEPGDSPYSDGGSFFERNPQLIDHLLQIGAVTHRHNAAAALAPLGVAPALGTDVAGGALPSSTTLFVGITLIDDRNGETIISPLASATTAAGLSAPATAPAASADYGGGTLRADTYLYAMTVTDGDGGETSASPYATATRIPGPASGRVIISGLQSRAAAVGGAGWRLYRSVAGGEWAFLSEGQTETFTDDGITCVDCQVRPPDTFDNTTRQTNRMLVVPPVIPAGAVAFRLYAATTAGMTSPSLVGEYPVASAGATIPITALSFLPGAPPARASSIPGAHKIDPDTEMEDFHWLRSVASAGALPSGAIDDVRLARDRMGLWGRSPAGWKRLGLTVTPDGTAEIDQRLLRFIPGTNTIPSVFEASGAAVVRIDAQPGGVTQVKDAVDTFDGIRSIEFVPGAGMAIDVTQPSPGSARVEIVNTGGGGGSGGVSHLRGNVAVTTSSLATGAAEDITMALGSGFAIYKLQTSRAARVRLYVTSAKRDADAARAIGADPRGTDLGAPINHGLILEIITRAGELTWLLSPEVVGSDLQAIPDGQIAGRVTNLDGTAGTVTVTITRTILEG